ncbi:MAG: SLC13 family permease [Phycisphaerales bacterium]|nr:SLC13 family permease [Phycisphaerales bacterium]
MDWQMVLVAVTLVVMLATLATGRFGTDIVMMGVLGVFLLTGILTPKEAFAGFSNAGLLTVAFLYVVATGLQETGAMSLLTQRFLGRPRTTLQAQARIAGPVAVLSAVLNNTPIVAMFMPVIRELSRRAQIPAGQLFMPLSFAAILGGCCTLIGTSTNLVVYSLINTHNAEHPDAPLETMGLWTLAPVGIPIAVVGIAYMLLFARRLLRSGDRGEAPAEEMRQYVTAMRVEPGGAAVGKTIEHAGLRHLPGLFLTRIDRATETVVAVGPDEVLREGDTLVFAGALESVVDLQKLKGLTPVTDDAEPEHYRPKMKLIEAVISQASPLVGRTIRDAEIRTRYGAAVIAVHRLGHRLRGRIGDIVLRPGDTLLLEAEPGFEKRYRTSASFHLVSTLEGAATPRHDRAWIAIAVLLLLVIFMSAGELPLVGELPEVVVAMVAAGLMIVCRCCTGPQARAGIEWPVLLVIGTSFGLGKAMEVSGLAGYAAHFVAEAAGSYGPAVLLALCYVVTLGFTILISNNAAAALMFPIALGVAGEAVLPFMPFALAIAFGASLEFMTPLGYQTNLMVMGPGGYRYADYLRFGGPLTVLAGVTAVTGLCLRYGLGF